MLMMHHSDPDARRCRIACSRLSNVDQQAGLSPKVLMPRPKLQQKSVLVQRTADFLNMAFSDYIASRVLLNNRLLVQGVILASTAIEKHFKAVLAFKGNESRGHLKKAHFNAVENFDPRLYAALNEGFLHLLQKAYTLRYTDQLTVGFNLVIAQREFLAELDYTAITMQESFQLHRDGKDVQLAYHLGKQQSDSRLWANSHIMARLPK
jgi:hypothetical protein